MREEGSKGHRGASRREVLPQLHHSAAALRVKEVQIGSPRLSEKDAVAVVKPVLKILYAEKLLVRQAVHGRLQDGCPPVA